MRSTHQEIEFQSEGATLRGRIHKAPNPQSPLVVLAHGFSATAHMSVNAYAAGIAEAGYHGVSWSKDGATGTS